MFQSQNSSKRVLITGASGGIGSQIALDLASKGYRCCLSYNKGASKIEKLKEQIQSECPDSKVETLSFDVKDRQATRDVILKDIEQFGIYYGVVCSLGITADNPFPLLSDEQWDSVIDTNLDGVYNVLKPVVFPMVQQRVRGRIITISSISGIIGNKGQINYSSSKAGIIGFTKALALELAKHKITVNCVAPGIIDTDMIKGLDIEELKKFIPMRRLGTGKDVASLVSFLMSEEASYITRQVISVNGGMI